MRAKQFAKGWHEQASKDAAAKKLNCGPYKLPANHKEIDELLKEQKGFTP